MQALAQLKILDFSTLLPGPYASMLLAHMGAQVLRVQAPRPDMVKFLPPQIQGQSAAFWQLNAYKQEIALDLKQAQDVAKAKSLIQEYDIVIEQFRPGVMQRLGLDYDTLAALNPRLIYCSITGYGQTGPYRERAGHDINYLALSGLADYSRRQNQAPVPQGTQIADIAGGSHHAVMSILAAVIQRQSTGQGQHLDISMTDAAFALNAMTGAAALAGGEAPSAENGWLNGGTFYDYYATSDGRYMAVGSLEPVFLAKLLETLAISADYLPLFQDFDPKSQTQAKALLTQAFQQQDFAYWCARFAQVDACVEPVLTFTEACQHPQIQARALIDQRLGFPQLSPPFTLQDQPEATT